jgi:hypothetical protein
MTTSRAVAFMEPAFLLKFEGSLHRKAYAIFQAMRHTPADCNKLAETLLSHKKLMR